MANTITDQFNLVQITSIREFLGLFARSASPVDGFSLEIFRRSAYLGSVLSSEITLASDVRRRYERMRVRDGDTIMRINLSSRMLDLTGTLYTSDGYVREYEIALEIRVSQPTSFAQAYLQQSDPLHVAKIAIERALQAYAFRHDHDDIEPANLRYIAEDALNHPMNQRLGIVVTQAHQAALRIDPRYAQMQGYNVDQMKQQRDFSERMEDDREIKRMVKYRESIYYDQEVFHKQLIKKEILDTMIEDIVVQTKEGMPLEEIFKKNSEFQNLFPLSSRVGSVASFPPAEDQKRSPHAGIKDNIEVENQIDIGRKEVIHQSEKSRSVDIDRRTYLVTFDEASPADVSRYTDELGNALLDAIPDIIIQRKRADPQAQEFGFILVLVLGMPVIPVMATTIVNWLKLRNQASLTVKTADEQIIVQNIRSKDAAQITHLLLAQKQEEKP